MLHSCGYDEATTARVAAIILRKSLAGDAEAQALEDALCVVFFETQLDDLANRLDPEMLQDVGRKTLRLMSPESRLRALCLPLAQNYLALLRALINELAESSEQAS